MLCIVDAIILMVLFVEYMVSELQAARILQHKELHPEDEKSEDKSEKEQRAEDPSIVDTKNWCKEYEDGQEMEQGDRKEETERELALLLQTLNMDESSRLTDVCHQVRRRPTQTGCDMKSVCRMLLLIQCPLLYHTLLFRWSHVLRYCRVAI